MQPSTSFAAVHESGYGNFAPFTAPARPRIADREIDRSIPAVAQKIAVAQIIS